MNRLTDEELDVLSVGDSNNPYTIMLYKALIAERSYSKVLENEILRIENMQTMNEMKNKMKPMFIGIGCSCIFAVVFLFSNVGTFQYSVSGVLLACSTLATGIHTLHRDRKENNK